MLSLEDLIELEKIVEDRIKICRETNERFNSSIVGKQLEESRKKEILKYERLKVKIHDLMSDSNEGKRFDGYETCR
ncbi:hypothetical protein [Brevibacillus laterosporus]|uniref:hypothetical protein n=1 Tax=Brevibacillus laterosporus TaxID=1465 RepID=UPI000E6C8B52|nr:hypothetical protein [Brevibacillus laterosporus]AYB37650.1 hypothetical protein D5F52_04760 [Brevibacillus laterosporus]MBM7110899.1 hypothetical protein [Brevibacillus laterosporus]